MELLICIDALARASARRITAVMPYFGYARQDRKTGGRTPISAKLVANLITRAGADRVLTMDLHAGQIQGFFDIPTDNLLATPVMAQDIRRRERKVGELMIVSPDVGGVVRARGAGRAARRRPGHRRQAPSSAPANREVMNIIGDVKDRRCILFDDIVDSAGTLCNAAEALMKAGAKDVSAYVTHGVLSGAAVERIQGSALKSMVVTDSIAAPRPRFSMRQDPAHLDRAADWRSHPPHQQRRKRVEPVRLTSRRSRLFRRPCARGTIVPMRMKRLSRRSPYRPLYDGASRAEPSAAPPNPALFDFPWVRRTKLHS